MHHEVHLRNIQLEANKYEKSAINAELARPLCTERASEKGSKSAEPRPAKGREKCRTKAPDLLQHRYKKHKNGADRVMHFLRPFLCTF